MAANSSREAFFKFLEWIESKGLMHARTAGNRRSAAHKILSILDESEASNVLNLDVDDLLMRFENLNRGKYSPSSLSTYRTNLVGGLTDFRSYVDDPIGFKPAARRRPTAKNNRKDAASEQVTAQKSTKPVPETAVPSIGYGPATNVLPVQIRPDTTVHLQGLPFDLTRAEAQKIANIVLAHILERDE